MLGALNLYYESMDDFSEDELEVAKVVAAHASVALAKLRSERDLWRAIDSRHLIGQAQGMLMERFKLSPEKSFAVLRRYSQQHNIKLHEVAGALIRTGRLPAEDRRTIPIRTRAAVTRTASIGPATRRTRRRPAAGEVQPADGSHLDRAAQLVGDRPQPAGHLHLADADLGTDPRLRPAVARTACAPPRAPGRSAWPTAAAR